MKTLLRRPAYRPGQEDGRPAKGPCSTLESLIAWHTGMYSDERTRAWVERRLRSWWAKHGGQ